MRWHSLTTYGLTSFYAHSATCPPSLRARYRATCFWPIGYDLRPYSDTLRWETDFTQQEVEDIVQQNGYFLLLRVNGLLLQIGPQLGTSPSQGYHAATNPNDPACPVTKRCFSTSVRVRNVLAGVTQPWVVELEITKLTALSLPSPSASISSLSHHCDARVKARAFVTRTIQPNQTSGTLK